MSEAIAALFYWPLARLAALAERVGLPKERLPLAWYSDKSYYVMRTDAYDRFCTSLEKRFSKTQITQMLVDAGFSSISFSDTAPYWCAVGIKIGVGRRSMPQKILYLVSEDWYFISHRLPMARAAKAAGYEVHVATRIDKHGHQIIDEGFVLHPVGWRRGSMNVFRFIATVFQVRRLYRELRPDLVHHVALVPTVVGSVAALGLPMHRLNAFAGLGYVFTSETAKARLARALAGPLLGWLLRRPGASVLVQNQTTGRSPCGSASLPRELASFPARASMWTFSRRCLSQPALLRSASSAVCSTTKACVVVEAHDILAERGVIVRTLVAGEPDPSNPASIPQQTLDGWRKRPNLILLGHVNDIRTVWREAHVADCRRGAKACRKACLKRRRAGGLWLRLTFLAAGKLRDKV